MLSEWTKFRTVRASFWNLAVGAALGIGLGILISWVSADRYGTDVGVRFGWEPANRSLGSLLLTQLVFCILGVMVVTGEYATGMMRTSLAAVPKRSRMLAAKTIVFTVIAFVAGEAICFVTFFSGQAIISGRAPTAHLSQPEVLRAVFGSGLYLAALALSGLALAAIVRSAAAAIGIIVAILLVLPVVAEALPNSWAQPIEEYWPTNAGSRLGAVGHGLERFAVNGHIMAPWTGFGVMLAFVAFLLVIAFVMLERRDA
jgi:ABC-type transport system involved in multi-copper enzyme maturation permease subunit